jgi:hypothetical protein
MRATKRSDVVRVRVPNPLPPTSAAELGGDNALENVSPGGGVKSCDDAGRTANASTMSRGRRNVRPWRGHMVVVGGAAGAMDVRSRWRWCGGREVGLCCA